MTGQRLPAPIFWIKLVHTLVFIVESIAILYIVYSGIADVQGPALTLAVVVVLAEIVVFVANGTRCPLTKLALRLGDTTGDDFIADYLLPKPLVRYVPFACGGLAFAGFALLVLRLLQG